MNALHTMMLGYLGGSMPTWTPVSGSGSRKEPQRFQDERVKKAQIKRDRKRAIRSK